MLSCFSFSVVVGAMAPDPAGSALARSGERHLPPLPTDDAAFLAPDFARSLVSGPIRKLTLFQAIVNKLAFTALLQCLQLHHLVAVTAHSGLCLLF